MEKLVQKILLAEDDENMQLALHVALSKAGYEVTVAGNGRIALEELKKGSFDLIISDQCMPEMTGVELLANVKKLSVPLPLIMITAHGTVSQAVEAMQLGAADFIQKPFSNEDLLRVVERVLSPELKQFRDERTNGGVKRPIVTNDPMMIRIIEVCEAVAKSDATVLIAGESGTGKELIARLIHDMSPRANQPFVAVNCAALPDNLLESELFGHEKGAFTGAEQRKLGKFELAQGGTILLDEISEMALPLQAKLLRVLQEREVDRVGGKSPIKIDVRVLATTNRNLLGSVEAGEFRSDLYYRLNVIPVTLPALRERKKDIPLLVRHFMKKFLGKNAPQVTQDVLEVLENYPWPGNVRELQNAVERAAILSRGDSPETTHFLLSSGEVKNNRNSEGESRPAPQVTPLEGGVEAAKSTSADERLVIRSGMTVAEMEQALIFETLRSTNNNRTEAARLLGISIRTLRNKLHEYRGTEDN